MCSRSGPKTSLSRNQGQRAYPFCFLDPSPGELAIWAFWAIARCRNKTISFAADPAVDVYLDPKKYGD